MSPLTATIAASFAGGTLCSLIAATSLALPLAWVQRLVAFAVGAMLGAVFLDVLPHGIETAGASTVFGWVLAGILFFFMLEKLVIWRHSHPHGEAGGHGHMHAHAQHGHAHDGHRPATTRTGLMVVIGNSFHNFSDGVLIAGAFLADFKVGLATAVAIIAHAIPQEMGDFIILRNSGMSRSRAFLINLGASFATLAGGLTGYFALSQVQGAIPAALGFAAASMLYIAVADLIPHLHQRPKPRDIIEQFSLIGLGVGLIAALHHLMDH
jgi:zinc and cadmium transporter